MISRPVWEQWHLNLHIKRPTSTFWLLSHLENDAHCYIFLLNQSLDEILKFNKLFCVVLLPLCWCTHKVCSVIKETNLNWFFCLIKSSEIIFYFFTCILPNYMGYEITKEFWKNSHIENMTAGFLLRCQNLLRWICPKMMHFQPWKKLILINNAI